MTGIVLLHFIGQRLSSSLRISSAHRTASSIAQIESRCARGPLRGSDECVCLGHRQRHLRRPEPATGALCLPHARLSRLRLQRPSRPRQRRHGTEAHHRCGVLVGLNRAGMLGKKLGGGLVRQAVLRWTSPSDRIALRVTVIERLAGMLGAVVAPPPGKVGAEDRHSLFHSR
jgi:hypothetical protein